MNENHRPNYPPGSKRAGGSGHKPDQPNNLSREVEELRKRVATLEASLNESNQWNNPVRRWIGQGVTIALTSSHDDIFGKLRGLDRYTLTLNTQCGDEEVDDVVIHKGAIVLIRLGR